MAPVSVASAEILPPPPQDEDTTTKSNNAEKCTVKCVSICIRSGDGEGPLNIRRPFVVFEQGFRSCNYCLVECSDICNLIGDGDYGP
ncbi:unnamed protein product [Brassica oleracea var. botrytis]